MGAAVWHRRAQPPLPVLPKPNAAWMFGKMGRNLDRAIALSRQHAPGVKDAIPEIKSPHSRPRVSAWIGDAEQRKGANHLPETKKGNDCCGT
jgi:hypothetical protein